MRVYVDVRVLSSDKPVGVANYTYAIIKLLNDIPSVELIGISNKNISDIYDMDVFSEVIIKSWGRFIPGFIFIMFFAGLFIRKDSVFLGLNHCVPMLGNFKRVLVIHDFVYKLYPETQVWSNSISQAISVRLGLIFCHELVFVSRYTREIFGYLSISKGFDKPMRVVPNIPVVFDGSRSVENVSKPFIFALGSIEPRKNLLELVREFHIVREQVDCQLVIAGPDGWKNSEFYRLVDDSEYRDDIVFVGYLNDREVNWCYKNCAVFCFPSLYEGFGIPPFEALQAGAKVVGTIFSELRYYRDVDGLIIYDPDYDSLAKLLLNSLSQPKYFSEFEFDFYDTAKKQIIDIVEN